MAHSRTQNELRHLRIDHLFDEYDHDYPEEEEDYKAPSFYTQVREYCKTTCGRVLCVSSVIFVHLIAFLLYFIIIGQNNLSPSKFFIRNRSYTILIFRLSFFFFNQIIQDKLLLSES